MDVATKFGRVVPCSKELPSIKSQNLLITWSCKVTRQIKYVISTTTGPLVIKIGKVVSYYERLSPIKSDKALNTSSFEIT